MTRPTGVGISFIISGLVLDLTLHYIWQFDYLFPGVGIFGFFMFPVAIFLLLGSAFGWLQRRQDSRFLTRLSLASPGPAVARLQLSDNPPIVFPQEPYRIQSGIWLPRAIGIALILGAAGISLFLGLKHWLRTRTLEPVNMPISLARGSVRTGNFYINLPELYYVNLDLGDQYPENQDCRLEWPNSILRTHLVVQREGQPVGTLDEDFYYSRGFFNADKVGYYALEIQVLSDASCLNIRHPRLRVHCSQDFSGLQFGVNGLAEIFFLAGIGLLMHSIAVRIGDRLSARPETLAILQVTQYKSYIPRPPLRKRFASLPPFGLFAAITLAVGAVLPMYVLEFGFRLVSRGIPVSVLRDANSTEHRLGGAVPIVMRIKDMGPGSEPQLYLNSNPVTWDSAPSALKIELARSPDRIVFVSVDDDISYRDAIWVMDIIRGEYAKVVLLTPKTERLVPAR
jgi:biopolymer transport protein ExbD